MKQFEFRAFVVARGNTENEARKQADAVLAEAKKFPYVLGASLDDSEGIEVEEE